MAKILNYITTAFLSLLSCTGCLEKDDVLPAAVPYTGDNLRTDGFYYQLTDKGGIYDVYFIYDNGVLLGIGGSEENLSAMEDYIKKNYLEDNWYKKNKYKWGTFVVLEDTITIYKLSEGYPHYSFIRTGTVLNDTTFKVTEYRRTNDIETTKKLDITYHFREFSPKPDSTNVYIK